VDPILNYLTPTTQRRRPPIPQWHIVLALFAPWLFVVPLWLWSVFAIRHFQEIEGGRTLWSIDQARRERYEALGIHIQMTTGLVSLLALTVVFAAYLMKRRLPWAWMVFLALLLSEATSLVFLFLGLMNSGDVLYP
jgi:hypothetical protein